MNRPRPRHGAWLLCTCAILVALWWSPSRAEAAEPARGATAPGDGQVGGLIPLPTPELEHLEVAVRDQLQAAHDLLMAAIRNPEATRQDRAQAYLELGEIYHAYGLADPAEACYRNAITLNPFRTEWNYNLGYLLQSAGRHSEAIDFFHKARAGSPRSPLLSLRLGDSYRALHQLDLAKQAYEAAYKLESNDPAILARLGEIALEERRFQDAVRLLEAALEKQPAANRLHYPLAMAYRSIGKSEQAREHLAQRGVVGLAPADRFQRHLDALVTGHRVQTLAGRRAYAAGRYVEAVEHFERAVQAAADDAGARVNLGSALASLQRYREASAEFREAVRLSPENVTARFNLGSLLLHLGEPEEAMQQLRVVVERQPKDPQARLMLAAALEATRQFGAAFEQLKAAVKLEPSRAAGWLGMSRLLSLAAQHPEAVQVLEAAHRQVPHDASIAHALARLLAASPDLGLRDGQRAVELAERVFQAQPHHAHAGTVAMAYAEADQCAKAIEWQKEAVALAAAANVGEPVVAALARVETHYASARPCRVPGQPAANPSLP